MDDFCSSCHWCALLTGWNHAKALFHSSGPQSLTFDFWSGVGMNENLTKGKLCLQTSQKKIPRVEWKVKIVHKRSFPWEFLLTLSHLPVCMRTDVLFWTELNSKRMLYESLCGHGMLISPRVVDKKMLFSVLNLCAVMECSFHPEL